MTGEILNLMEIEESKKKSSEEYYKKIRMTRTKCNEAKKNCLTKNCREVEDLHEKHMKSMYKKKRYHR